MRCVILCGLVVISMPAYAGNWPQWRGPQGNGVSEEKGLPLTWNDQTNIVWKCSLPGEGASTPVVWDDALYLTAQKEENLLLLRINKTTGKIEWTRTIAMAQTPRGPLHGKRGDERRRQKFHELHNLASPSPVTDGERVIAHFGTGDLAAYDDKGRPLWNRNLQNEYGPYTIWWGHANSPVLFQDLVISVCMQDSLADLGGKSCESYVVAHDKRTGKEIWKTPRMTSAEAEACDSYITPVFRQNGPHTEMIVVGGDTIDAYDPATGKQIWCYSGIAKSRIITGPTVGTEMVFFTCGMRGDMLALRPSGSGRLPASDLAWKTGQGTPDSSCPVVYNDLVFWVSDNGVAQCRDAGRGELKWSERIGADFKASPLAADRRIYFLERNGTCTVVAAGPTFQKLASNTLADEMLASPAVSDGRIYLRGKNTLYCIGDN
jgi:outer membrane protein assembly factor BamB